MEEKDQRQTIYRTLLRLLQEHFFLEPKSFANIYEELVRPSSTSAGISYDKKLVSDELRILVREGALSMEGKFTSVVYFQREKA
jgi:hypothetical protein